MEEILGGHVICFYIKLPYINYKLEFNRKVTVIRGESGTGNPRNTSSLYEE